MLAQPFSDPGEPDLRSAWAYLWWLVGEQRRTVLSGSLWGVAWMGSQAAIPFMLGGAIEDVVRHDRGGLVGWSGILLGLGIAQAVAGVLRHRKAVANFIIAVTRTEQLLSRAVSRLGPRLTDQVATGEVANLGGADVERIGELLDTSARFSGAVVSYLGVTVVLLVVSPGLGAVVAVGAAVVVVVVGPLVRPLERRQRFERDRRAEAASLAADTVVGLRILRGLGGEAVFASRFKRSSQEVRRAAMGTARVQSTLDATQVVLPQALVLAVTWLGARLVLRHHLDPGQLVSVYAYAAFLVLPVQTAVEMSSKATAARVAAGRVIAVLGLHDGVPAQVPPPHRPQPPPAADDMPHGDHSADAPGTGLASRRDGRGTLVDPTTGLVVESGRLTGVVTPTPDVSAELVDRLGRWVDPPPHLAVTLDGTPLSDLPILEARRRVLVVDRESTLLAGRVADLLDPPSGRGGGVPVDAALAAAAATDVVAGLPDGLDTELPERGRTLSGGQRQRLLLAQALIADPEVLVLDEPTSAVDAHTEAAIGGGIATVRRGRTTVICTTSPLLLAHADSVVLIDGAVAASGRHADLLVSSSRYRAIVTRGSDDGPGSDAAGPEPTRDEGWAPDNGAPDNGAPDNGATTHDVTSTGAPERTERRP